MPDKARVILICDVRQLDALFTWLNLDAVRVVAILGSVLWPATYRHPSGHYKCYPACNVDALVRDAADFCIIMRNQHDDDLLDRLAARGFGRERVVDLDYDYFFNRGPGLLSAATAVREGRLRWDGFMTGMSYYRDGVLDAEFGYRLANFAERGQDLYYDYALAREVLVPSPQKFRFAVIGLAPYSLQYDMAKTVNVSHTSKYLSTLRDAHGAMSALSVPVEQLFSPEFFRAASPCAKDLTIESFPALFFGKRAQTVTLTAALAGRSVAETWRRRSFPATEAENARILGQYVDLCRAAGIPVFIATSPMTPVFRAAYGPDHIAALNACVRAQLAKPGVWWRDFYAETDYGRDCFFDADHLNPTGAKRFSTELRTWIEQSLAAA